MDIPLVYLYAPTSFRTKGLLLSSPKAQDVWAELRYEPREGSEEQERLKTSFFIEDLLNLASFQLVLPQMIP